MKIEINDKGTNNYYDEFLFLLVNHKKIRSDSNIKIMKLSSTAYFYLAISIIIFIIFLTWYIISKEILQLNVIVAFMIFVKVNKEIVESKLEVKTC